MPQDSLPPIVLRTRDTGVDVNELHRSLTARGHLPQHARRLEQVAYEWPDADSIRETERRYFLIAVRDYAPEVLEQLADAPYAIYHHHAAFAGIARFLWSLQPAPISYWAEIWKRVLTRCPVDIEASIRAWARHWRINTPWILDTTLGTLDAWFTEELETRPEWRVYRRGKDWNLNRIVVKNTTILEFKQSLVAELPPYDPSSMTRQRAEEQIIAALKKALPSYLDQQERVAEQHGMAAVASKEKRQMRHYEWLVRYWVLRESLDDIAAMHADREADRVARIQSRKRGSRKRDPKGFTASAVEKAIFPLAERIGLPVERAAKRSV